MSDRGDSPRRLPAGEGAQVARQLAGLSADALPLAAGLRAAAAETRSRPTARVLQEIAANLDRGAPLEQAVRDVSQRLPAALEAALDAATATGDFGPLLLDVIDHQNQGRRVRWSVLAALAYPLALLVLTLTVFAALQLSVVRSLHELFDEFELQLPLIVEAAFWWAEVGAWLVISGLAFLLVVTVLTWLLADRATWFRLLGGLPLIGPIWQWTGHAEIAKLTGLLIGRQLPLAKSVALASAASDNAAAGQLWQSAIDQLQTGQSLSNAVAANYRFPGVMPPYLSCGEQTGQMSDALLAVSELLTRMADTRSRLARNILPIFVLICVAVILLLTVVSMLLPPMIMLRGVGGLF